jgi:hypothetical protein
MEGEALMSTEEVMHNGNLAVAMSFALGVGMRRFRGTLSFQVSYLIFSANITTTKEATHRRKE